VRARFGSFSIDTDSRRLDREGRELHLTPKAFDLLVLLMDASPKVVSKRDLHARLWPDSFVADATLVGLVKEIRRVLEQRGAAPIRTYHRVGYAFSDAIETGRFAKADDTCWLVRGRERLALREGENLIGRDPASAIWLDVSGVSRRHARLIVAGTSATLEDLGSKNGTLRGTERVTKAIALRDGDRLQIAGVSLVFRATDSTASTDTQPRRVPRKTT
jgi:DNA-binding winged helix-turn-helix (wHTH) protein